MGYLLHIVLYALQRLFERIENILDCSSLGVRGAEETLTIPALKWLSCALGMLKANTTSGVCGCFWTEKWRNSSVS